MYLVISCGLFIAYYIMMLPQAKSLFYYSLEV